MSDRPGADHVAEALLVLGAELSVGVETRASPFDHAAERRAIDGRHDVGDVVEQPLRHATAPNRNLSAADAQKEKLVGADQREHQGRAQE